MSTHPDERGVPRQDHYGAGTQPWDTIVEEAWAPEYAAGNILKYLRRTKAPEHSLESARWFYARLGELARGEIGNLTQCWVAEDKLKRLSELLTHEELARLK